ncbi:MAG: AsmA-like C-terminal region-containing protein [bacterium]|nr:AsmA-like C-terminal region-containing protein [bacterium]
MIRRIATFAMLSFGWLVFVGAITLLWLEASGLLADITRKEIARSLELEPDELVIGGADLQLRRRTLVLRDVQLGNPADLRLDVVELRAGWSAVRGAYLESALVDGGHLRLSRALTERLRGVSKPKSDAPIDIDAPLPALILQRFGVSVDTTEGEVAIGRVDANLREDAQGVRRLVGRLENMLAQRMDDPGTIYLAGQLLEGGVLEVRGSARDLALSTDYLPPNTPLEGLRALDPRGLIGLEANGRYVVGASVLPEIDASVRIAQGSLRLPHLAESFDATHQRRVEDVTVDLELSFAPTESQNPWDPQAWAGTAHVAGSWQGQRADAFARIGGEAPRGFLGEAWLHAPEVRLDDSVLELGGDGPVLRELWSMLEPRGRVGVAVGARLPSGWTEKTGGEARRELLSKVEAGIVIQATGEASCAYVGGLNRLDEERRNLGFPLRAEQVHGDVAYTWHAGTLRPGELGLFDLRGRHPGGTVEAQGQLIGRPRQMPGPGGEVVLPFFHLLVQGRDVRVDDDVRRALHGLEGIEGIAEIYPTYAPHGGEIDFDLEMWASVERLGLATALDLHFDRVGFQYAPLPLPIDGIDGHLALRTDGRREDGRLMLSLAAVGTTTDVAGGIEVAGRVESGVKRQATSVFYVEVSGLDVNGTDLREALRQSVPEAIAPLEATNATGRVDTATIFTQPIPRGPRRTWTEIESAGVGAKLEQFPFESHDVNGRVIIASTAPPGPPDPDLVQSHLRASLHGNWMSSGSEVPIAVEIDAPFEEPVRVRALGAGLDVTNPTVIESFVEALSDGAPVRTTDPTKFDVSGHIDFETLFALSAEDGQEPELEDLEVELLARLPRLGLGDIRLLHDLEGRFRYESTDEAWVGERLRGELGSTPVELTDFRWRPTESGARMTTRFSAKDLPVDEEHLQYFLDEDTLRTLLEELECRGRFDVKTGLLTVMTQRDGGASVGFEGTLALNDVYIELGLPVSIRSTEEVELDLYYEGDRVRARARVRELYGQVAGHSIDRAKMHVTYIEPRLSIEQLEGRFEGGALRSLGHGSTTGGNFFSADLQEPFGFALSARMDDVDVGSLLAGVFNSNFANEGQLDGEIRLRGDIDNLLDASGSGHLVLSNSSLWAIPVFQELFSQLGFDTTAIFKQMTSHFTLRSGALHMTGMQVESDLLSLVGSGSITLDGRLRHDLEVRYSLLDKLGPLKRLLYEIQNSLIRVSIRGDMSRPKVVLGGFFSQFLQRPSDDERRLPVPALSSLPERF